MSVAGQTAKAKDTFTSCLEPETSFKLSLSLLMPLWLKIQNIYDWFIFQNPKLVLEQLVP